jgi:hypothetical protein
LKTEYECSARLRLGRRASAGASDPKHFGNSAPAEVRRQRREASARQVSRLEYQIPPIDVLVIDHIDQIPTND